MKRRFFMAVGMSALLAATLLPGTAAARSPDERGFRRVELNGRTPRIDGLPSRQNRNRPVMVLVELTARPVAHYQAEAIERDPNGLSEARKAELRAPLVRQQNSIKGPLRNMGARVHASFTDVVNGLRVTVNGNRLSEIARLPNVKAVYPVGTYALDNENSDRYLRAHQTWSNPGYTGRGVRVAIIDSGINYYHRNFGGGGNAPFQADNPDVREPGTFPTSKVVAGYDFVGDCYDPGAPSEDPSPGCPGGTTDEPQPDPDPLDCKDPESENVQHGSHVAGTAAGKGVRADGTTYNGPYNANALNSVDWRVPPGVAPQAKLMAYRVFGCSGGTNLVVDAIERAVRDGADVINMSLGLDFGSNGRPEANAVNAAVMAGVTVVASAGNDGPSAYITGSPGTSTGAISVGAMDAIPGFPAVSIDMPTGANITAINANGDTDNFPITDELNHFEDNPATPVNPDTGEGGENLGCFEADYVYNGFQPGQIAVVHRGICARIQRAEIGDEMGASAVIMINNADSYPPFEGDIPGVDIPFLGVPISVEDRFHTDDGGTATLTNAGELPNPDYQHKASFTSGGPRRIDNMIKPDVIAPGVGVLSTAGATGSQGRILGGTSMAAPAVAGLAALVVQANPGWAPRVVKAAIMGTSSPGLIKPYEVRLAGAGVPNALRATQTRAYATDVMTVGSSSLTFGYAEIGKNPEGTTAYSETRSFRLWNRSSAPITYNLSNQLATEPLHTSISISPSTVTVPAGENRQVNVTVTFSEADAAALPTSAPFHGPVIAFDEYDQLYTPLTNVAGAIKATPTVQRAGVYPIRVPWMVVPRANSVINENVKAPYTLSGSNAQSSVRVKNYGLHAGYADVFAWGLMDQAEGQQDIDLRAGGVQSLPSNICTGAEDPDPEDRCLVFAINTWQRWDNPANNEYDVLIDTAGDGDPEFALVGIDVSQIIGAFDGVMSSTLIDLNAGSVVDIFLATGAPNTSTLLLPILASELGLDDTEDSDFNYWMESYEYFDDPGDPGNPVFSFDVMLTSNDPSQSPGAAHYDAFDHAISNGNFAELAPGQATTIPLSVDTDDLRWSRVGHKGWLVVTIDDKNGEEQADMIPVGNVPRP